MVPTANAINPNRMSPSSSTRCRFENNHGQLDQSPQNTTAGFDRYPVADRRGAVGRCDPARLRGGSIERTATPDARCGQLGTRCRSSHAGVVSSGCDRAERHGNRLDAVGKWTHHGHDGAGHYPDDRQLGWWRQLTAYPTPGWLGCPTCKVPASHHPTSRRRNLTQAPRCGASSISDRNTAGGRPPEVECNSLPSADRYRHSGVRSCCAICLTSAATAGSGASASPATHT